MGNASSVPLWKDIPAEVLDLSKQLPDVTVLRQTGISVSLPSDGETYHRNRYGQDSIATNNADAVGFPVAIATAKSTEDVVAIVKWASWKAVITNARSSI